MAEAALAALEAQAPARGRPAARRQEPAAAAVLDETEESDSEEDSDSESDAESDPEEATEERHGNGAAAPEMHFDSLPVRGTLVVVPKSLLGQWKAELEEWAPGLKVLVYSAAARRRHELPQTLAAYDVVLASPAMVLHDSPLKHDRALFRVQWWRVIIDEAQCIKRHQTGVATAVTLLQVQQGGARWLMSGTPIQNSPAELFSYMQFLRYEPFNQRGAFHALFRGNDLSMVVARSAEIVRPIVLRRTKESTIDGVRILDLPERNVALHPVSFSDEEQQLYDAISVEFVRAVKDVTGELQRKNALQQLNQLRAACNHPWMAKGTALLFGQADRCTGSRLKEQLEALHGDFRPSAKMRALQRILDRHAGDEKILVFSTWTTMLDLVEISLADSGLEYRRLDGGMSSRERERCVAEFRADPTVRVFLISLLAGKEGLNLAEASRVVLLEPHFNPMHEQQAIDRTHRIGQTRPVHAHKLYVQGSVEERLLELQEHKMRVAGGIIQETRGPGDGDGDGRLRPGAGLSTADLFFLLKPDSAHKASSSDDEEDDFY